MELKPAGRAPLNRTATTPTPSRPDPRGPALPAIVAGTVAHRRRDPIAHSFRLRHDMWLVDADHLPDLGGWRWVLGEIRPVDHLGAGGLRENLARLLAQHAIGLADTDRIVMLANPRSLGHVFDPLTVYWIRRGDDVAAVVLEVNNTYGGRHPYVLVPDAQGRAEVDKQFYVSPFHDVSGRYVVRAEASDRGVVVSVALDRPGARRFSASVHGPVRPLTLRAAMRSAMARPLPGWRVSALIRAHGIWLWARGLPVRPRPVNHVAAGVDPAWGDR